MKTLNNYIQILPDKGEEKTEGGIVIPEMAREKPMSGIVERAENEEWVGKRVYYPDYCSSKIKLGNVLYHFVKAEELILITEGN